MYLKANSKLKFIKKVSIYLFVLILLYGFFFVPIDFSGNYVDWNFERKILEEEWDNDYFVKTEGCRMPSFPVHSEIVDRFIYVPHSVKCKTAMTETNDQHLWITLNRAELNDLYGVKDVKQLLCTSTPFFRKNDSDVLYDTKNAVVFGFGDVIKINVEYVHVSCDYGELKKIHEDYHFFYPKHTKNKDNLKSPINVMIIGIDSVSRLNFHRQMPKTVEVVLDKFKAIEMFGYNKLGDNTYPNLMPLLTGFDVKQLTEACVPIDNSTFDNCNFIWQKYKAKGYKTVFGDDKGTIGLFNYFRGGFKQQPTDFYPRPIVNLLERHNDSVKQGNTYFCVGPHRTIDFLLSYITKFVNYIEKVPYFSFFWTSTYTHDYFNDPQLIDDDFAQLLTNLWSTNAMKNTFLIFMSDYGLRFGGFRRTYQGMMEERQPFLYLIPPNWFYDKYPKAVRNLFENRRKLTTHFDLHETLQDLANLNKLSDWNLEARAMQMENALDLPRAISLFLPIPDYRTCESAAISDHWCTCHDRIDIATDDTRVKLAADKILQEMHTILRPHPLCQTLALSSVDAAYLTRESYDKHQTYSDITLRLRTVPGLGEFESTVRMYANDTLEIIGLISRINLYGRQSKCIEDHNAKLYCYCKNLPLNKNN